MKAKKFFTCGWALALGMLNVIINEELYDKLFVERWTVGFNELKAHIQQYTPGMVSCWHYLVAG